MSFQKFGTMCKCLSSFQAHMVRNWTKIGKTDSTEISVNNLLLISASFFEEKKGMSLVNPRNQIWYENPQFYSNWAEIDAICQDWCWVTCATHIWRFETPLVKVDFLPYIATRGTEIQLWLGRSWITHTGGITHTNSSIHFPVIHIS